MTGTSVYDGLFRRLQADECRDLYSLVGPESEEAIQQAEQQLGVRLPESFRWFLRACGPGQLGEAIYGATPREPVVGGLAEARRLSRCPPGLVPFAEGWTWVEALRSGSRYVCFDTGRQRDGEYLITEWVPEAGRDDRLQQREQTFLEWLVERVARAEQDVLPPTDWRNNAGWERYWSRILADDQRRAEETAWGLASGASASPFRYLPLLRRRDLRSILCAGNGMCLDPYGLAHVGLDVTVVDVSLSACRFLEGFPVAAEHLARLLPEYEDCYDEERGFQYRRFDPKRSLERVAREHVPGGRVCVVTDDLFLHAPSAAYDAIYSNRAFQGFADEDQQALAQCFAHWLRPGGVCFMETINVLGAGRDAIEGCLGGAGFFIHARHTDLWYFERTRSSEDHSRAGRRQLLQEYARRLDKEQAEEEQRLDAGERMVVLSYCSG